MRRNFLYGLFLTMALGLAACDNTAAPEVPTPLPEPPTLAPSDGALPTVAPAPTNTAPPDTVQPPATLAPTEPPTAAPAEPPTAAPTTAAEPTAEPTSVPTAAPPTESPTESLMAPGQRATGTLAEGQVQPYQYNGVQFQPAIFFVEPSRDLDVDLLALVGAVAGPGLGDVTPAATANNALSGRPELVVHSPEGTGVNTFVVRAAGGSGDYTAYLFNLTSPATGMAVQQADTLAAGETKRYEVTSNGARPVIAMADPTNLSDLALDVFGPDGTLLTTANFSGPGGVEVAYVLPLGTVTYTIAVREVNGMLSNFDVAVVTLE